MDAEIEFCNRENAVWQANVAAILEMVTDMLRWFDRGYLSGNEALKSLNQYADSLADLGWRGREIPV